LYKCKGRRDNISNKESSSENKRERKGERDSKLKSGSSDNFEKVVYINERVRLCAATPASIIGNRTPPPASQKHHFTQKHQINFCIDDIHRAPSQRERAVAVPNLIYFHYGTSNY